MFILSKTRDLGLLKGLGDTDRRLLASLEAPASVFATLAAFSKDVKALRPRPGRCEKRNEP